MQIGPMVLQVKYWITNELPWRVEGDVAAPLDLEDLESSLAKLVRPEGQAARLGAATQGHHRVVLDQQEQVVALSARDPFLAQSALEFEHRSVPAPPEVDDADRSRRGHAAERLSRRPTQCAAPKANPARITIPIRPASRSAAIPSSEAMKLAKPLTMANMPWR